MVQQENPTDQKPKRRNFPPKSNKSQAKQTTAKPTGNKRRKQRRRNEDSIATEPSQPTSVTTEQADSDLKATSRAISERNGTEARRTSLPRTAKLRQDPSDKPTRESFSWKRKKGLSPPKQVWEDKENLSSGQAENFRRECKKNRRIAKKLRKREREKIRKVNRANNKKLLPKAVSAEKMMDETMGSIQKQTDFVDNLDFIKLIGSDDENEKLNEQQGSSKKDGNGKFPDDRKRRADNQRGTKRKFGVSQEESEQVRKKRGGIVTPWFDGLRWKGKDVQQMLTAEIGAFVSYIRPTPEEDELRHMVIETIRQAVQIRWPDADVEPFGSFGTKLYLPGGDIDLVLLSSNMMNEKRSKILYKLAQVIRERNIGQDVVVIAHAKVPIIKFRTIFGNFNVDISINQSNGIVAMKKVRELLDDVKYLSREIRSNQSSRSSHNHDKGQRYHEKRPETGSEHVDLEEKEIAIRKIVEDLGAAKCLILVVKSVLKQRGMNEVYSGGLGSYSIICLVVSFLQLHPKIQRGDIDPNRNLGVLLLEFFELYGKNYNFHDTGVSVRKGGYYYSKAKRGWQNERKPNLLSIEDPADESNDIAGGTHNILGVRSVFSGAFDLLSATLYYRHSLQSSRTVANHSSSTSRPLLSVPVPFGLDDVEDPESKDPISQSLLGEIMGVTKDLVDNRRKNLKLFYSGTLQRLLNRPAPPSPAELETVKPTRNPVEVTSGTSKRKKSRDRREARQSRNKDGEKPSIGIFDRKDKIDGRYVDLDNPNEPGKSTGLSKSKTQPENIFNTSDSKSEFFNAKSTLSEVKNLKSSKGKNRISEDFSKSKQSDDLQRSLLVYDDFDNIPESTGGSESLFKLNKDEVEEGEIDSKYEVISCQNRSEIKRRRWRDERLNEVEEGELESSGMESQASDRSNEARRVIGWSRHQKKKNRSKKEVEGWVDEYVEAESGFESSSMVAAAIEEELVPSKSSEKDQKNCEVEKGSMMAEKVNPIVIDTSCSAPPVEDVQNLSNADKKHLENQDFDLPGTPPISQ
ncbi:hypothetical protein BY996DRAFT_7105089 [Phakopsora pachyrhizi]|nr:hypothetical protein BY996DRAFT_7105089 [Phakopsora pachyrhizi]